jgi:type 1 fimbriae regulatory protein FimB/type 1 fimbriae regulatory protein FimE
MANLDKPRTIDMSKSALRTASTNPEPTAVLDTRRDYLTEAEVEQLIRAAANDRDAMMILIAYRHGLRVSELVALQWRQIDLKAGRLSVWRLKGSDNSVHPLSGREIRGLRKLQRQQAVGSRFVFLTNRDAPMTRNGFFKLLAKAAETAGIEDVHPHLLRHGTGFKLVNQGLDTLSLAAYLGHRNVQNTKRYAKMNATRFDGLWKD